MEIQVKNEVTPNPESMKFKVNQIISEESLSFDSREQSERSPLALKLFGFPWAKSIYIGPDFITITKQEWVGWDLLLNPLMELIREHIEDKKPIINPITHKTEDNREDTPVIRQIKEFLDKEVRPFVAMDGGDILFESFKKGVLYIYMRGACSGCPSATVTLKNGIEARIKEKIPEVITVMSVE